MSNKKITTNFTKIIITILFIFCLNFSSFTSFASEENDILIDDVIINEETTEKEVIERTEIDINKYEIEYKKNLFLNEGLKIDLTNLKDTLEKEYPNNSIDFEWSIKKEATKNGYIYEKEFEEYGEKEINLNIYKKEGTEKKLIVNSKLDLFVYEKSLAFLFNETIGRGEINNFITSSRKSGVYIYNIGVYKEKEISNINLNEKIAEYKKNNRNLSDYIGVWGEKEFLFTVVSKLQLEDKKINSKDKINLVLISPFNTQVIKNYLSNLVSDKSSVKEILFMDESIRFQTINKHLKITDLESSLIKNKYDFLKLDTTKKVESYFFISKFINNLSNKGFSTTSIYIIMIIPFLFTLVSFSKHFIGISPLGLVISIFLSILFFKVGILVSSIMMALLVIINLIISKLINKYTLLYTPKVSFIAIINIIMFIIAINMIIEYSILDINLSDSIYIILFIIVSEKLITIIISKEFREYKTHLLNTFIISIIAFFIFNLDITKTFILAYPEIIIFLVPVNFIIGRFTGLRITEYFRFREVIKSIEEE